MQVEVQSDAITARARVSCAGWVINDGGRKDHACQRVGVLLAADGRRYCRAHDPKRLAAQVQRLLKDGKRSEAELVAQRRGVVFSTLDSLIGERPTVLTRAQFDSLRTAVADHLAHLAGVEDLEVERHRRRLAGALAALEFHAAQPGPRPEALP